MRASAAEREEKDERRGNGRDRPQARKRSAAPPPARKTTAKPAARPVAAKPEPKARGGKGLPTLIRDEMIKNPAITTREIEDKLTKKGVKYSSLTVSALRSQIISTMRALDEAGHLKGLKL